VPAFMGHCRQFCVSFVVLSETNDYKGVVTQNFLVFCQTERTKEVRNAMAVPSADDGFRPCDA